MRMERAPISRSNSVRANARPLPPPPKTRARFAAQLDVPVTPTGRDGSFSFAGVTAVEEPEQAVAVAAVPAKEGKNEPARPVSPGPVSAREVATQAIEKRMQDSGMETGGGCSTNSRAVDMRVMIERAEEEESRVEGGGVGVKAGGMRAVTVAPRSPSPVFGGAAAAAASGFLLGSSQFQASALLKKTKLRKSPRGAGSVRFKE